MHEPIAEIFCAVEVTDVDFEKSLKGLEWSAHVRLVVVELVEMVMEQ